MRHLVNHSVYKESGAPPELFSGDGIELLTGYSPLQRSVPDGTVSVHLPYAVDWYGVWKGRMDVPDGMSDDEVKFVFYGGDREGISEAMMLGIDIASSIGPEYGVMHAGSADLDDFFSFGRRDRDEDVLSAFAEALNNAVAAFPGGEPPFKLLFENQWWPGLRMLDDKGYRILRDRIEFENWGLCLDTGHLLVATQRSSDEGQAIGILSDVFDGYPEEMIDDIITIHLHTNSSAGYLERYDPPEGFGEMDIGDRLREGSRFVFGIDSHLPFTRKEITEQVERLRPEFVTHEMGAGESRAFQKDYVTQRSLFI